jgi:hypothetical protein
VFTEAAPNADPVLVAVLELPEAPVVRLAVLPDRTSEVPVQPSERQELERSSMSIVPSSSRMSITRS